MQIVAKKTTLGKYDQIIALRQCVGVAPLSLYLFLTLLIEEGVTVFSDVVEQYILSFALVLAAGEGRREERDDNL